MQIVFDQHKENLEMKVLGKKIYSNQVIRVHHDELHESHRSRKNAHVLVLQRNNVYKSLVLENALQSDESVEFSRSQPGEGGSRQVAD